MQNKICPKCKNSYPATPEYFHRNRCQSGGLNNYCKICDNKRRCKDYQNDKEGWLKRLRIRNWKVKYNITPKEREKMYADQNGRCVICDKSVDYFKINTDHNHETGKVRGLLCQKCNMGLSYLENIRWNKDARKYLKDRK